MEIHYISLCASYVIVTCKSIACNVRMTIKNMAFHIIIYYYHDAVIVSLKFIVKYSSSTIHVYNRPACTVWLHQQHVDPYRTDSKKTNHISYTHFQTGNTSFNT